MPFSRLFIAVFFIWQTVLPAHAAPEDLQQTSAYWIDRDGHADIDTAMRSDFTPYQGRLALGYLPYAVWVRLRVAPVASGLPLVLRIEPAFLREIALYDPAQRQDGRLVPKMSGRISELDHSTYWTSSLGYTIPSAPQARDIYLRIDTPTALAFSSHVHVSTDAFDRDRLDFMVKLLYVAVLLLSSVWALANFIILRESLYGWFALRQLFATAYVLSYLGLLRFFLSGYLAPAIQDMIYNYTLTLVTAAVVLFEMRLLREFRTSRRLRQICLTIAALTLIAPVMVTMGHVQSALKLCLALAMPLVILMVMLAFSARRQEGLPLQRATLLILRIGYLIGLALVLVPSMGLIFGLHFDGFYLTTPVGHAALATMMLMSLLAIRSRQLQILHQRGLAQQRQVETALVWERSVREEKQHLISMLTHELKNPLSVVRLLTPTDTTAGRTVQRAADDIGQVIERVYQSEKIFDLNTRPTLETLDLRDTLERVRLKQRQPERIRCECSEGLTVRADRELIHGVFSNLFDNALKYSPEDSIVRCFASDTGDAAQPGAIVRLYNLPGSAGVPDPAQVFTKYYRSPQAHREIGSGLGLFLVSEWMRLLGGTVQFSIVPGEHGVQEICLEVFIPR